MLEGLVAWVLNNYLGKYVENLNTDQLSVALLSGKVELENLPLKKDALRHLGLPVEVVAGLVGRVRLQVPVRQIRSAPWLIHMEQLYLVAAPLNLDEWDSAAEAVWAHERKLAALGAHEARWRATHDAPDSYYASSYSSWLSYGASFIAPILDNLQLKLTDVHIRYEDTVSCGAGCAGGLTIGALAGGGGAGGAGGFKLFELSQLALYWDPMPDSQSFAKCTPAELTERMSSAWSRRHRYVLQPCGAAARVRRDHSARAADSARLQAVLTLPAVATTLHSRQYEELVSCWRGLERLARVRGVRALRPHAPLHRHARDYWIYALRCHSQAYRWTEPRPTWESCLLAARRARAYVCACAALLANPAATLPHQQQRDKDDYEWNTPQDILIALREVAMRRAEVPKSSGASTPDAPAVPRSVLVQWFPAWWGWYGGAEGGTAPPAAPLDEEILDVIADSLEEEDVLTRDALFGRFEFLLTSGCLQLSGDPDDDYGDDEHWDSCSEGDPPAALELEFTSVRLCVEVSARGGGGGGGGGALTASVAVGGVCLREHLTPTSLFPVLVAPHGLVRAGLARLSQRAWGRSEQPPPLTRPHHQQPLFQLTYERKPLGHNYDYKLWVKSASLEVVWSAAAVRWALAWARAPFRAEGGARGGRGGRRTAQRLMSHIGHMMQAGAVVAAAAAAAGERRAWHIELDMCAPQILLVEDLCDRDAAVMVVDFGRLRLSNATSTVSSGGGGGRGARPEPPLDEDEPFLTPCSTPPGSPQSPAEPPAAPAPAQPPPPAFDATSFHDKLYDRYKMELSDLQILVGRARDNWKYAHTKPSSALHLLDRFTILLQLERRVVCTQDPLYPTGTLRGSLPALVAHLSEHKVACVRSVLHSATVPWTNASPLTPEAPPPSPEEPDEASEATEAGDSAHGATVFMLQFAIEQVAIEVQSLGRSIAEVQVGGARAVCALRGAERSLALSVHSLLLVDALQTLGPDFELLVASHKHLGMDTASGSILGSEPTSPSSPASPAAPPAAPTAHPHALQQALHSLNTNTNASSSGGVEQERASPAPSSFTWQSGEAQPEWGADAGWGANDAGWGANDEEALIVVEITLVRGDHNSEDLRIANILFNNLDIIANQETIVELIGFAQRVARGAQGGAARPQTVPASDNGVTNEAAADTEPEPERQTRTEITFDFHRLGVLLLRAGVRHGAVVANKIATATVSGARIQATLDARRVQVGGSLGGVQVVSLCEGAGLHARVLCAGRAPSVAPPLRAPSTSTPQHDERALLFSIDRTLNDDDKDKPVVLARVSLQVARVWYTHSGALLLELQSCLTEFKQYLANLARSIRAKAKDMAITLVQPRGESLYANPKLSQSMEGVSPRRRTTSMGYSLDDPPDLTSEHIELSVSVELESPVVVIPRAAHSAQVLVAHLGRMSLSNRRPAHHHALYRVRLRDISLAAVDVSERLKQYPLCAENMSLIYSAAGGAAIVHDTAVTLNIAYCAPHADPAAPDGLCEVVGSVVGALAVSAARAQYEQLLETVRWVTSTNGPSSTPDSSQSRPDQHHHSGVDVGDGGGGTAGLAEVAVPTLQLDPQLRAAVLAVPPPQRKSPSHTHLPLKVVFTVPCVSVSLRADLGAGECNAVQLTACELRAVYQRHAHHSTTQVSLHSVTMEDLSVPPQSKHRLLMVSHTPPAPPKAVFVSRSSPDLVTLAATGTAASAPPRHSSLRAHTLYASLPSLLNVADTPKLQRRKQDSKCGATPPCSPEPSAAAPDDGGVRVAAGQGAEEMETEGPVDDNLVWINVHTRSADHPDLATKYNNVTKRTRVDFNCVNLVLSIDSWVAVLDFFGLTGDDSADGASAPAPAPADGTKLHHTPRDTHAVVPESSPVSGISQTETSVRLLSLVVVLGEAELCRAAVRRARLVSHADATRRTRALKGSLASLALTDLTPRSPLWRDRFRTHHDHALTFHYQRLSPAEAETRGYDSSLELATGPVRYVHTKRFVQQLQAFAGDFSRLSSVIAAARSKVSVGAAAAAGAPSRLRLSVRCLSPAIVVPVSGRARAALFAQLDSLSVDNAHRLASSGELVDERTVQLCGLAVWAGRGGSGGGGGGGRARRQLLAAPAPIQLIVTTNLSGTHHVPDMTISGTLATLCVALQPAQYRLVRGVLAHNLGECTQDLQPTQPPCAPHHQVWTLVSLKLALLDVTVRLQPTADSTLAVISLIRSRLVVETYSDLSQDVDLVSAEVQVADARYAAQPANRRANVFSLIVQPLPDARHTVQVEIHARRRSESCAYTILVNNMRLMAVLDWWEAALGFLLQPPTSAHDHDQPQEEAVPSSGAGASAGGAASAPAPHVELKLNVTDSQLVLVEDASVWDTNAVILLSTTVITYRGGGGGGEGEGEGGPCLVTEVSALELFSCVLGLEEETALPILQPAALTATLHAHGELAVELGSVDLRLSYHDMLMFAAMARSLPLQARAALHAAPPPANRPQPPPRPPPQPPAGPTAAAPWPLRCVRLRAECVALCVIDDCRDSDVPLLECALTQLTLLQDLRDPAESFEDPLLVQTPAGGRPPPPPLPSAAPAPAAPDSPSEDAVGGAGGGRLTATLSADYYNRALSGWEPLVEPWHFVAGWEYTLTGALRRARVQLELSARGVLDVNVTAALLELVTLVRANWTQDYYAGGGPDVGSPPAPRRRAPFVPYALRNDSGHKLWFTTLLTTCDKVEESSQVGATPDDSWVMVRAGDTEPFSFGARRRRGGGGGGGAGGARGGGVHPLHRLALRLEQWLPAEPVCVDRVGVFWREVQHAVSGARARLVLHVTLEGSARKLVTVRSALRVTNRLPHPVELRVHAGTSAHGGAGRGLWRGRGRGRPGARHTLSAGARCPLLASLHPLAIDCASWSSVGVRMAQVDQGHTWAVPLGAGGNGALWARPLVRGALPYAPCALPWRGGPALLPAECRAPPDAAYRFTVAVSRDPFPPSPAPSPCPLVGHSLCLLPALRLRNLLPVELQARAAAADDPAPRAHVVLPPGADHPFTEFSVDEGVELSVKLEGFGWSSALSVGGGGGAGGAQAFGARLKLRDLRARRLYLSARVECSGREGVTVAVSAAYWLINRTGLPLVYRAEGAPGEAAGQFDEHEVARMVAPLVFAFAEAEGGPTLQLRLGRGVGGPQPEWSAPFPLGAGIKRLTVRGEQRAYWLGVQARAGSGRYRHSQLVSLAPRHQLHNTTPHVLQFAQKCAASTVSDPSCAATHATAPPACCLPWHWPRADRDPLLCVRLLQPPAAPGPGPGPGPAHPPPQPITAWSGGFRIDTARTLHVACRALNAPEYTVVRVETAAAGCSLLTVLSALDAAPPPLRVDNYSPVAVMLHQAGGGDECVVGAHAALHWALPEPEGPAALALRAPGGPRAVLPLDVLPSAVQLVYQNFIYVVFTATLGDAEGALVLEVGAGSARVQLSRRRHGDRAQLWRRGPQGQLVHEGSGPPSSAGAAPDEEAPLPPHALVLDIEDAAPRPPRPAALVLRRADPRRQSTQAWRVTPCGRMQCAHSNLCVQGQPLLAVGARAVLALPPRPAAPPPPEQAVGWHTLRPGSGRLDVTLQADGPTRLVTVRDHKAHAGWLEGGGGVSGDEQDAPWREWGLRVALAALGVSLVGRAPPAELVYARLTGVALELSAGECVRGALAVHDMQWDNQLAGTPSPVLLHALPAAGPAAGPVLSAAAELARAPRRYRALYFRHLMVALRPLAVRLEERLMLLLYAWGAGGAAPDAGPDDDPAARALLTELTTHNATRCYFALIKIMPSQIRLSMCTAPRVERPLAALKRRLGLTLVRFEDAAVELEPFVRAHAYDTPPALARHIAQHFKDELKWQAAKILGSVDFLGNPLGFVADVSEGVSGLLLDGNLGALVTHVTHGLSDSAAKVSASLGDGLQHVVGDDAHEETRRRIRQGAAGGGGGSGGRGGAHLAAGLRQLGLGLLGGVTSLVKHTYEGAAADGLPGLLAGVGKGLVGTVTKPVIGVLDLAAEAASALRDSSGRGVSAAVERVRAPRCAAAAGSLLPRYCPQQAGGARALLALNGGDAREQLLAYGAVRGPPHDIRALLSTTYLRIFTAKHSAPHLVMETHLSNLMACSVVAAEGCHFVELVVRGGGSEGVRRPRVQCDSATLAAWLATHALYARQLHHEHKHALPLPATPSEDDDTNTQ